MKGIASMSDNGLPVLGKALQSYSIFAIYTNPFSSKPASWQITGLLAF